MALVAGLGDDIYEMEAHVQNEAKQIAERLCVVR
jgi:hypothetical protein